MLTATLPDPNLCAMDATRKVIPGAFAAGIRIAAALRDVNTPSSGAQGHRKVDKVVIFLFSSPEGFGRTAGEPIWGDCLPALSA